VADASRFSLGIPVGGGEHLPPADFLLMAGFLTYEAPFAPTHARVAAQSVLRAVLSAATACGFASSDLLDTMMSRAEKSARVYALAEEAARAIGDTEAFLKVVQTTGISTEGDL